MSAEADGRTNAPLHSRLELFTLLALLALGLMQFALYQRIESYGSDSSVYIVLAENLCAGAGNQFNGRPQTVYPPGFPILLAALGAISGETTYEYLIRWMPVCSTLGLVSWYFVLRHVVGTVVAAVATLLAATTAPFFALNTRSVLSEPAYILSTGVALLCLSLLARRRRGFLLSTALILTTVFFVLASVMIRSVGVALGIGMAAWALSVWPRERELSSARWTALLSGTVCLAVLLGWVAWTIQDKKADQGRNPMGSYVNQFLHKDPHSPDLGNATPTNLVARAASNLPVQTANIALLLTRLPWVAPLWYSPLVVFVLLLLICGLLWYIREVTVAIPAWYFLTYFGVYLLWPFGDEGPRFMLPIAPLAFVMMWQGSVVLCRLLPLLGKRGYLSVATLAALYGLGALDTWPLPGLQAKGSVAFWVLFAAFFAYLGFRNESSATPSPAARPALVRLGWIAIVILTLAGLSQQTGMGRENLHPNPERFRHHAAQQFGLWLRSAPSGVVMAQQTAIIHRISRRIILQFPVTSDATALYEALRQNGVRFLMVSDPVEYEYFLPSETERYKELDAAHPGLLVLLYRSPGFRVFEVAFHPPSASGIERTRS